MRLMVTLAVAAGMLLPVAAQGDEDIRQFLAGRAARDAEIAHAIWNWAEVGYQEERSSALLQSALAGEGFEINAGVAGIPTAFVASFGTEGPVIGILAEFDALPGITQDALPTRSPIPNKPAAHACGHNLFGAGSLGAALAVRHWLEDTGTPGTISYKPNQPPCFQMMTVAAPTTMPASAPLRVMRFHPSENSTTGPNAAPKPAHA